MTTHLKKEPAVQVKQEITITPADRRYMIFLNTTVVMLCAAIILSSF